MYGFCSNSDEHKREGREDYNRYGRYGYDSEKYHDHWSDCNRAYRDGFDEEIRRDDQRREEREREERIERQQMREARERREMREAEEEYLYQQDFEQEPPPQMPEELPF